MDAVTVFFSEVAASIVISAFILVRLQRLLRGIGTEVCEQGGGATEFWLAYTQLMMLVAPVLLISWFSHAGQHATLVAQLKSSFGVVLSGQFIGLALVGRAVWKSIVPSPPKAPFSVLDPAAATAA